MQYGSLDLDGCHYLSPENFRDCSRDSVRDKHGLLKEPHFYLDPYINYLVAVYLCEFLHIINIFWMLKRMKYSLSTLSLLLFLFFAWNNSDGKGKVFPDEH